MISLSFIDNETEAQRSYVCVQGYTASTPNSKATISHCIPETTHFLWGVSCRNWGVSCRNLELGRRAQDWKEGWKPNQDGKWSMYSQSVDLVTLIVSYQVINKQLEYYTECESDWHFKRIITITLFIFSLSWSNFSQHAFPYNLLSLGPLWLYPHFSTEPSLKVH